MPRFGVQFLCCLSHFNTSEFNEINPDLQQQARKITVLSGRPFYQPPPGAKVYQLLSLSVLLFSVFSGTFYLPFLLKIQLPSMGFLREAHSSVTVAATDLPRVSAEAKTQTPFPGRMPTGRGSLCHGRCAGLAPEQGLIYNDLTNAKHSSLSVLIPFGSNSLCKLIY